MDASQDFEAQLAYGNEGEHEVGAWMIRRGHPVIPLYPPHSDEGVALQGRGAPSILWANGGERIAKALPDLAVFPPSGIMLVEVKRKRKWVRFRGGTETGFNASLYREYSEIADRIDVPVWVFFLHEHEEPTGWFAQSLTVLRRDAPPRLWDGRHHKSGLSILPPMVLWPLSVLVPLRNHPACANLATSTGLD